MNRLILLILLSNGAQAQNDYFGNFQNTQIKGEGCESVFANPSVNIKVFLLGPSHTQAVFYFTHPTSSFFEGKKLFGRFDPWNQQFLTSNRFHYPDAQYVITFDGYGTDRFIFGQMRVQKLEDEILSCEATAECSGFPARMPR